LPKVNSTKDQRRVRVNLLDVDSPAARGGRMIRSFVLNYVPKPVRIIREIWQNWKQKLPSY